MLFLRVPLKEGEGARRLLISEGVFVPGYPVLREKGVLLIPCDAKPGKWHGFDVVERDAARLPQRHTNLKGWLSEQLSASELDSLVTAYDVIGDIIIIEIPAGLEKKEKAIAEALLKVTKNAKVVAKKLSPMEGEFRVRRLKVIGGEDRTETIYREHGCRIKLDVGKVYFSVRLSHERKRISGLVKPGERILALFAGVGPFPLVIAREHPDAEIIAIELNPDAVRYMEENVLLNKAKNVTPVLGDARETVMGRYRNFADRILMPLPKSAEQFLDVAFEGARDGCIVHTYGFDKEGDPFSALEAKIHEAARAHGATAEIVSRRVVRPFSPGVVQAVIDFRVIKGKR